MRDIQQGMYKMLEVQDQGYNNYGPSGVLKLERPNFKLNFIGPLFHHFFTKLFCPFSQQPLLRLFSSHLSRLFLNAFPMAIRVSRTTPDPTLLLLVVAASKFVKEFCPFARVIHLRIHHKEIYCSSIMMLSATSIPLKC